jgi:hypothetical protein
MGVRFKAKEAGYVTAEEQIAECAPFNPRSGGRARCCSSPDFTRAQRRSWDPVQVQPRSIPQAGTAGDDSQLGFSSMLLCGAMVFVQTTMPCMRLRRIVRLSYGHRRLAIQHACWKSGIPGIRK